MNNSESAVTSSEEVFTEPQTFIYPSSWDSVSEKSPQSDILFHNEHCSNGTTGIGSSRAASDDVRDTEAVEVLPRFEIKRPDFGLWLLYRNTIRPNQWERLRETMQSSAKTCGSNSKGSPRLVKRCCDVAGSLFLLIVLFPLFFLIAILIKLDSPGSAFFRHYRVGKDGRHFVLWKFRSMRTDVPKYDISPQSIVDVRLTRVGRVIRRMSIDEMPQLINVLKGEMSLVGPRPEMPFIVAQYRSVECERLTVKPGITGLWQISPARAFPIHENLQYDLHYVRNQNFFLDCAIILRTITAVIHGIGAV
jgi:lipopolysaccharide/colanic/teichoic acid biosynthesis glycosyltransferase